MKARLKEIVVSSETRAGRMFDLVSQSLVLISLVSLLVETSIPLKTPSRQIMSILETTIVTLFTVEYLLRIWAEERKLKFMFSFYGLVDLIAILPFYIGTGLDLRSLRIIRILRLFHLLKLARFSKAMVHIRSAFVLVKAELLVFLVLSIVLLYISSLGIYTFEHPVQPEVFSSVLVALWWSVVTLSTVGYGDVFIVTAGGRIFASCVMIVGVGVIAVPTGLITSALMMVLKDDQRGQPPVE